MKSSNAKNTGSKTAGKNKFKFNSTNQVIFAAIAVLLIFLVAMLSSVPKKVEQPQTPAVSNGETETRSGTQVARISITRNGETQQALTVSPTGIQAGSGELTAALVEASRGGAFPSGNRVKFKIEKFQKLAVQPLKFVLYDEKGRELTPEYLQTAHEEKIHFILVTSSLREYQHLNPEYRDGQWNVSAYMPIVGTYYAYIDFTPVSGNQTTLRSDLTVRESTKGAVKYPGLTPNMLAITDGVSTVLSLQNAPSGSESSLNYSLTRDGKNVTNAKPYLGAFGNIVLLRHNDPNTYIYARQLPLSDESKGMFDFASTFMKAGRYTAFAEFKLDKKVLLFPITFDVQ